MQRKAQTRWKKPPIRVPAVAAAALRKVTLRTLEEVYRSNFLLESREIRVLWIVVA
jgi:hypothetical protein